MIIKSDYPVLHTQITTCEKLYQEWKETRKSYKKAPDDGITLNVEYADTKSLITNGHDYTSNEPHPVVLALHGAPGSHQDFAPIIKHLSKQGVRIIAPNFPDYNLTLKTKIWKHSAEEKGEFVKDFLRSIGVKKINLILSHSSAIYPSLILSSTKNEFQVDGIALFNPGGHRRIKGMKPAWFIENAVKAYKEIKLVRAVFKTFGTGFLNVTKVVALRPDDMNNVILSGTTMTYSGFKNTEEKLIELKQSGIPLLFVFSENDRLIEKEVFYEMAEILGAKKDDYSVYDEEGKLFKESKVNDSQIQVVVFQSGGHYAFLKYVEQINKVCSEFLCKVITHKRSCQSTETHGSPDDLCSPEHSTANQLCTSQMQTKPLDSPEIPIES